MRAVLCRVESFSDQVDSWVADAIRGGIRHFGDLLRGLPGVYPVDVAASVRRLSFGGDITRPVASRLLVGANCVGPVIERQQSLPAPHPLDYDWRFTATSSAHLFQRLGQVANPGDTLVCLGAPSVYEEALRQGAARRAALVDANSAIVSHFLSRAQWLRVWRSDLLTDPIPALHSSVVMADPPWYFDQMVGFLWAASQICTVGGHVFVSLPPKGTRPGVVSEVGRLIGLARAMGFDVDRLDCGAVQYESPPFERNALRAAGIHLSSYDWRCGDLCILRLRAANNQPRPLPPRSQGKWVEEELSGMRVRLRKKGIGLFADPVLTSLVDGDILPSVSRRHPLRQSVDVWTAGNRVFSCAGTNILRQVIRALARGQNPVLRVASALNRVLTHRERQLIVVAARQMTALARQERRDFCYAGVG